MKNLFTLILATLIWATAGAQIDERIEKSWDSSEAQVLSIKNSFGDITIRNHQNPKIEVIIEINVVPAKSKDMDKVKDKVKIDVRELGNRVELATINNLDGINTTQLDIDYEVRIPDNTSLEIKNQFGDVWIENTMGNLYARVQHGDLFVGKVGGKENSVKVQFGELRLEYISDADLEVHHGDFQADILEDVELEMQFSDGKVGKTAGRVEFDIQHSDLKIEEVLSETTHLDINGQFSDIELERGPWQEYHMELEGGFTDFSMSSEMKSMIYSKDKGMNSVEYELNRDVRDKRIIIDANHSDVDFE